MTVVRQTVLVTMVYNKDEVYAESGAEAISHSLFNEDGMLSWDFKVLKEEEVSADINDKDLELVEEEY